MSDEVRWLSAEEQRAWRAYLEVTTRLAERLNRDLQRTHALSLGDYAILVRLSEAPNRQIRMSSLAVDTHSSKSRLSHAIARLETDGFVERRICPTDKRGWLAVLTDAGFERLKRAAPDHVESVRRHLLDAVSPEEYLALGATLQKIARHLRTSGRTTAGAGAAADPCG